MSINSDIDRKITHLIAKVAEPSLMKSPLLLPGAEILNIGKEKYYFKYTHAQNDSNNKMDISGASSQ